MVKITKVEYEEYKKLKHYKKLVFHEFGELKEKILLLKILSEIELSAVSKEDIGNLIYDNIDYLFRSAIEYDDLITNYIDMEAKK